MKILLTGGSGLLGQYLKMEAWRPTHQELDITKELPFVDLDLIVHCAAYTDVQGAETKKDECFDVNVQGVLNLIKAYPGTPLVYISTEYAKCPVNFYSMTKRLAEDVIRAKCESYLIIRTLFKPKPWAYPKAFEDQFTLGGYIDEVAPRIEQAINEWDRKPSLIYVGDGRGRKTMFELAQRTKPNVIPNSIKEMKVPIPNDYT